MAVRTDVTIDFDVSPRLITVAAPSVTITIQDLYDTCRTIEAVPNNLEDLYIIDGFGKQDLGGGTLVGITAVLRNAKLEFEARGGPGYTQCRVSGGNLVAVDANNNIIDPINPTAFTQVVLTQSSSATLSSQDVLTGHIVGGRSIDYTGNDSQGWQRVEYDENGTEIKRYNLFDENDVRISGTVANFITSKKMIAKETPV